MLYSNLIGKTKKELPKDETSLNAQLLIKGGFIEKEMAGVYAFLPLGYRVLEKTIKIIREEMVAIDGQEVFLGSLQRRDTWEKTNRWGEDVLDVWFKTRLRNGTEVGLANTHEEPLTKIMTKHVHSYKDLPVYAFQIQTKFRNEARAKSGLLRTREFVMKDLYSFNKDEVGLDRYYERVKAAYHSIFERLDIGDITFYTVAGGGAFSKFSHEFQTVAKNGEDTIYLDRKQKIAVNKEVYNDEVLGELGLNKKNLEKVSAIEVGNIFKLKTRFSAPLGLLYIDEDGKEKPVVMGSYGIGPGRALATVVETHNDERGIIWPESIAPYKVHLVGANLENENTKKKADSLYEKLISSGVEVLYDDRQNASVGEKFAEADLIGCPYRVVVSKKTGEEVELKKRGDDFFDLISTEVLLKQLT